MIRSITVTNHLDDSLKLDLARPEESGLIVCSVSGLGPVTAAINLTESATIDGASYNSSRLSSRNIVLQLKYLFLGSIEDARQLSYKYFPIKKRIRLVIETDNRLCETYGWVESNSPNIFSKMSTTQISIICPDPYFYSLETNRTVFSGVDDAFEFPFSNESLDDDVIVLGDMRTNTEQTVFYSGDAEVGFTMTAHMIGPVTNFAVYDSATRSSMKISSARLTAITGADFKLGDDLVISTLKGNKSVSLFREGLYINLINCLDRNATWFTLSKGDNLFVYTADSGIDNIHVTIENKTAYEGV